MRSLSPPFLVFLLILPPLSISAISLTRPPAKSHLESRSLRRTNVPKNSLLMPLFFAHFLRLRFYLSPPTRQAFSYVNAQLDQYVVLNAKVPEGVRKGVKMARELVRFFPTLFFVFCERELSAVVSTSRFDYWKPETHLPHSIDRSLLRLDHLRSEPRRGWGSRSCGRRSSRGSAGAPRPLSVFSRAATVSILPFPPLRCRDLVTVFNRRDGREWRRWGAGGERGREGGVVQLIRQSEVLSLLFSAPLTRLELERRPQRGKRRRGEEECREDEHKESLAKSDDGKRTREKANLRCFNVTTRCPSPAPLILSCARYSADSLRVGSWETTSPISAATSSFIDAVRLMTFCICSITSGRNALVEEACGSSKELRAR